MQNFFKKPVNSFVNNSLKWIVNGINCILDFPLKNLIVHPVSLNILISGKSMFLFLKFLSSILI